MYTGESFLELCNAQDVKLHPTLLDTLASSNPDEPWPEAVLFSLQRIGTERILNRENRGKRRLANKRLTPDPELLQDTPARVLTSLISDSIYPRIAKEGELSLRNELSPLPLEVCTDAEARFIKTIGALGRVTAGGKVPKMGSQIITDANHPMILRKAFGEDSGLTLAPILVDGIEYPAGSIVALHIALEDALDIDLEPTREKVAAVPVEQVRGIEFCRLSAFALTQTERLQLPDVKDSDEYTRLYSRLYDRIRLDNIRTIASRALSIVQRSE